MNSCSDAPNLEDHTQGARASHWFGRVGVPDNEVWDREGHAVTTSCHSLWIGPSLGALERACLRSVVRQGHDLTLWHYGPIENVPAGIHLRDGRELLEFEPRLLRKDGSPALFSNLFRYELQRQGLGTWIDCDMYLLKPLDMAGTWLIGEEEPGLLNIAILRLPADSAMLHELIALFREQMVPPWLDLRARLAAALRFGVTGRTGLAKMPWGVTGPRAVTFLAGRSEWPEPACPPDVFYPVHWRDAHWIFDPGQRLEDKITDRTIAVHLWNEMIKRHKAVRAERGSFMAQLQDQA